MRSRRNPRRASVRQHERRVRAIRRASVLLLVSAVLLVTLALTAFASTGPAPLQTSARPMLAAVPDSGPPRLQVIAVHGSLRLALPVAQPRLTVLGYHAAGAGTLGLEPIGRRGNQGFLRRLLDRIAGGKGDGLTWYQLAGRGGPPTSALDVGAMPGTDVYSPVDGTVVSIDDYVIDGRAFGSRIDIQPNGSPSLVVSVTRLRTARELSVGSPVSAAQTPLGRVLDFSAVETQALARYTQDAGNHVTIEVRPAAALTLG